jgi:hypothetical protein
MTAGVDCLQKQAERTRGLSVRVARDYRQQRRAFYPGGSCEFVVLLSTFVCHSLAF